MQNTASSMGNSLQRRQEMRLACAYDRVRWLRSERNGGKERNVTQQPMPETEFGVMGFDPYCQMLLGLDSERLPGWCRPNGNRCEMASGSYQLLEFMAALSR
ncbi:hypothetical protein Q8A67_023287 [Cirrhinus molitorella]|uniref:Uncharacterized protein n=1 Tax=Cirrhinus molitorella TaxID=172907 RepID=A0AA88NZN2_9TELE|nr:hypothetical protein Q8A67_023287 [Cirrhinus molitorella]